MWPQLADTPSQFYFLSLRSINIFGIVDDGGIGTPIQTNMLYDQTTASKGYNEVISMLYKFLQQRHSLFASRNISFHADNCVGQNKNNALIHFFLWCIANGIVDHIELKFLLKGHTKFSPDAGFGLIKKHYRTTNIYTIDQVAEEIEHSTQNTKRNLAIILERKDFGNWKQMLQHFFLPLKGITGFSVFTFDNKYPLGEVRIRKHGEHAKVFVKQKLLRVRDNFIRHNLLKPKLDPDQVLNDKRFTQLPKQLSYLEPPPMPIRKQWDLYEKVRPYVPVEYQDVICPLPNLENIC